MIPDRIYYPETVGDLKKLLSKIPDEVEIWPINKAYDGLLDGDYEAEDDGSVEVIDLHGFRISYGTDSAGNVLGLQLQVVVEHYFEDRYGNRIEEQAEEEPLPVRSAMPGRLILLQKKSGL